MKKKSELLLDFTSLLDVIMIILFVVICNMNNAAMEANQSAEAANKELILAKEQLSDNESKLDELTGDNESLKEELAQFTINGENTSQDKAEAFGSAIDNTVKVMLKCKTGMDIDTNNHKVSIDVVIKGKGSDTSRTEALIIHDFSLSREERAVFNATQVKNMTETLKDSLLGLDAPLIWFMIEYDYKDENFSNTDLEMINDAIDDLSLLLGITCQVEELRE